MLTLAQDKGPALVGRVSWTDPSHMTFRIVGDGPDDPGLSFSNDLSCHDTPGWHGSFGSGAIPGYHPGFSKEWTD